LNQKAQFLEWCIKNLAFGRKEIVRILKYLKEDFPHDKLRFIDKEIPNRKMIYISDSSRHDIPFYFKDKVSKLYDPNQCFYYLKNSKKEELFVLLHFNSMHSFHLFKNIVEKKEDIEYASAILEWSLLKTKIMVINEMIDKSLSENDKDTFMRLITEREYYKEKLDEFTHG
jgi:uncharacterized protein YpiB (UPF0302 family)